VTVGAETATTSRRAALVVVCGILALTFLDTTVVSVALASIQSSLHLGVTGLQWVVDAYALAFASLMLTGGTLGDRYGRRRVMLFGVALFGAASLMGALARSGGLLIASRTLMGVGAAASEPGTLSVLRHLFPERRERARALGIWAAVSCLGLALGPLVGGVLVGAWSWRGVFWLNVAAAAVLLVVAVRQVPDSADPDKAHLDLPGQLLVVATLATLVVAVIQGETSGYGSGGIVALFVIGGACGLGFGYRELRTRAPMLDLRYFRRRRFNAALAVAFAVYFGAFSIFFFTALYLEVVVGYSGYRTALLFVPMTALMVAGALAAGRFVVERHGSWVMAGGSLLAAAGIAASEPLVSVHPTFAALAGTLALAGLGIGTAIVPVTMVVLEEVPAERSGMAASATNTARQLGVVFGVAILGSLVNAHLTSDLSARLHRIGVPASFNGLIINAIEQGSVPHGGGGGGVAGAQHSYGSIVDRVISAAYAAFHDGLAAALVISAILIAVAACVAAYAARRSAGAVVPR
jgi:EmrB/QacA subfamily drug resistance transporter